MRKDSFVFDPQVHFPEQLEVTCIGLDALVPVGWTFALRGRFPPGNNGLSGVMTGCPKRFVTQLSKPKQMTSSAVQTLLWDLSVCLTKVTKGTFLHHLCHHTTTSKHHGAQEHNSIFQWSVWFGSAMCSSAETEACNNQFLAMQLLAKHSAMSNK